MKLKTLIILLVIIILLTGTATLVYFSYFRIIYVQESPYYFSVSDRAGLVGDRDAVKFGTIPLGGSGSRRLNFTNTFDFPVKINIKIKGEKSDWILAEENNFIIQPNNYKEVRLITFVPGYAKHHINYTGTITAYYIKT